MDSRHVFNHNQTELIPYIIVKIFPCLKRMKVACLTDDELSMVRPTDGPDSASGELEVQRFIQMKLESHFLTQNLSVLTRYVPAQNTNKPKNMWWLSILLVCLFGKGLRWATGLITPTPVSLVAIPVEF